MKKYYDDIKDISSADIDRIIGLYIHSQRDRVILRRRLIDGISYEKLAEEVNLSVRQTKNIVYKYEPVILGHLK